MRTIKALLRGKMVGDIVTIRGAILPPFRFCRGEYLTALPPLLPPLMLVIYYKVISKIRFSRDSLLNKGASVVIKVDWYGPCARPILYVAIVILVYAINL